MLSTSCAVDSNNTCRGVRCGDQGCHVEWYMVSLLRLTACSRAFSKHGDDDMCVVTQLPTPKTLRRRRMSANVIRNAEK